MQILRSLDELGTIRQDIVMAVGVFDGVHLGHQQVIQLCREQGMADRAEPWVMTFNPHPLRVVQPAAAPPLLTTLAEKLDLLARHSVSGCMVIPFTHDFSGIEPEKFLDQLVQKLPRLRGIVIGENWRFGREARGDVELLKSLSEKYRFHVRVAAPVMWQNATISSTRIRDAIHAGHLDDARFMLGRPHAVRGPVIHGQKRGRHLGFPTANLEVRECALPPPGIYAARVTHEGRGYGGALYLPAHPDQKPGPMEVHLMDFSGDLYGKDLRVEFMAKIREDNQRFTSEKDLIAQIQSDVSQIRNVLK